MKSLKLTGFTIFGYLASMQQAYATLHDPITPCPPEGNGLPGCPFTSGVAAPEIDGTGAIIAVGLVIGLVALVREKFYR